MCKGYTTTKWLFDFGVGEEIALPVFVVVGLQQRDRLNNQLLSNDCFYRTPDKFAQCIIATENYPDAGKNSIYAEDNYRQVDSQIVSCFNLSTKDHILQPFLSQQDFTMNNVNASDHNTIDIGYILFFF